MEEIQLHDRSNPFDDVYEIADLNSILNDSAYENISVERTEENLNKLKVQMANENINELRTKINEQFSSINQEWLDTELTLLRTRLLKKGKDLYLRDPGNPKATVTKFGNKAYKAIKITKNNGKLYELSGLKTRLRSDDTFLEMLQDKTTSDIDQIESLRETMVTTNPNVIEESVRPLLQSKEIEQVLTHDDIQNINKYLDFLVQNKTKIPELTADIEFTKKGIEKAKRQLQTEIEETKIDELKKFLSDSEARIITSERMLEQIYASEGKMRLAITDTLKSKTTIGEKLKYIFKKYGLTITAISLALGLIVETIVSFAKGGSPSPAGSTNIPDKVKQSLRNFANWLLEMSKKALEQLPGIIGNIISFLLKTAASLVGFLAEHLILFVIALAFAIYEAIMIGVKDVKRRTKK